MPNWTLPSNTTDPMVWFHYTNQITNEFGLGSFFFILTFFTPFLYLISVGQDKTESAIMSGIISTTILFLLSLAGLVPVMLVMAAFMLTGIAAVLKVFGQRQ